MAEIKAIETNYNGYRFRSRLEARWAVFFDAAFIDYQYEPEGFVLSNGSCYLPDFYLPGFHMFIEIKSENITDEERIIAKEKLVQLFNGDMFSKKGNGITVALFEGDPINNINWIYCNLKENGETKSDWFLMKFVRGAYGEYKGRKYRFAKNVTTVNVYSRQDDATFETSAYDGNSCLINANEVNGFVSSLRNAKLIARRARFEYGE